ncbi:MAG: hypothetical protein A3C27_00500 [Candidatus Levybacteria bacterium RIFCSPHIGHO2_02_FULL_39_36]|nr:MAG: hypothetical protein UT56_C0001G0047 [Candidatus Levybacteria bacterium GW2011_GWB1_39_7]KKR50437.1 MAG: hypothetical protein UT85_C0002G0045 [Candidatus Levybacteria bacterium GW2011_GWA2_40_16]OGH14475.1 MAG: hypothetical protein A2689_00410 [Candidatus Levybacteria bacterium RIFCSPHIGHO2_01_FULL_38_96]OGH25481.1 MAG: hypothetical protein A3E68_02265 [Candidatus Levybacteria bacterium RIFCSPHIGHO2_12_FULL_39_39]OGH28737.1 MAG: hypothetical protein A3C27_00500 [Candidatus Levybacteria 
MLLIKFIKDQRGQTIVEATIALASILLALTAISIAVMTSLNNSSFIKDQTLASKYAQQGMEHMRYLRNIDPVSFEAMESQIYCMNPPDNSLIPGQCSGVNIATDGQFKREAEIQQSSLVDCSMGTKIIVTVYWASSKCDAADRFCHKSQLISCFSRQSDEGRTL